RSLTSLRPHRACSNPLRDRLDLIRFQLATFRHFEFTGLTERGDDQTLVRIAGHDCRSGFAAAQHALARIQPQAAKLRIGMTREAFCREYRPHLGFEEIVLALRASGPRRSDQYSETK